jgi:hypothetical protein
MANCLLHRSVHHLVEIEQRLYRFSALAPEKKRTPGGIQRKIALLRALALRIFAIVHFELIGPIWMRAPVDTYRGRT